MSRLRDYYVDGNRYQAYRQGDGAWVVTDVTRCEHLCSVYHEGSRWISSGFPGKKWRTLGQAIIYTVTMRDA